MLYIYSIPPDDGLHICLKHVEVEWRNKLRINSASSWFSLQGYFMFFPSPLLGAGISISKFVSNVLVLEWLCFLFTVCLLMIRYLRKKLTSTSYDLSQFWKCWIPCCRPYRFLCQKFSALPPVSGMHPIWKLFGSVITKIGVWLWHVTGFCSRYEGPDWVHGETANSWCVVFVRDGRSDVTSGPR